MREILDELRAGRFIVLVDDPNRENEGDVVMAAEKITPAHVNFMLRRGELSWPSRQVAQSLDAAI